MLRRMERNESGTRNTRLSKRRFMLKQVENDSVNISNNNTNK